MRRFILYHKVNILLLLLLLLGYKKAVA